MYNINFGVNMHFFSIYFFALVLHYHGMDQIYFCLFHLHFFIEMNVLQIDIQLLFLYNENILYECKIDL